MSSLPSLLRVTALVSTLVGVVHLLVPDGLLGLARWSYDRVLAVRFQPRENAPRRVRAIGLAMLCGAYVLDRLARWLE